MTKDIVSAELLAIMQCPRCGGELRAEDDPPSLVCGQDHRYPVIDGIPDMVIEE